MSIDVSALREALDERYAIEEELGTGGMATVFLATDLRHERQVALKVLRTDLGPLLAAERFLREIRISAGLTHPNILPLHDSGTAAGYLYFVMPYIEGETLRERLRRERTLPIEDACQIAAEVADALEYAHGNGVLHRDVKPENILLAGNHAIVADFGLARALERSGGERLTQTGIVLGTPAYASPEQILERDPIDGRSDQYSLATVLYEMLCGGLPFDGSSARMILVRKTSSEAPDVRGLRETVSDQVAGVIGKALARRPSDRFRSMAEFSAALGNLGGGGSAAGVGSRDQPAAAPTFWQELRRRHVYHTAVVYAGAAWILIEVTETTFPYLSLPQGAVTAVIALAILGFPVAIVLSWLYEITRDGVRRTQVISVDETDGR